MTTNTTTTNKEVATKAKKVKIKIPLTRNDKEDYWVAVNGEKYLIKRGEYVEVPEYIAEAIQRSERMIAASMEYEAQARK